MTDLYKYVNKTNTTLVIGSINIQPYDAYYSYFPESSLDKLDGTLVDKYINQEPRLDHTEWNYHQPVVSNTKGDGLKLRATDPKYGWHDLLSPTIIYEGASSNKPAFNTFIGAVRKYQYTIGDESYHEFHLPHDYAPGTDLYIHVHWSTNNLPAASSAVSWKIQATYAKGYSQEVFGFPKELTLTQTAPNVNYSHNITEIQLSTQGGSATQLNTDNIETDGLILVCTSLLSNNMGTNPFMLYCDVHYQSTGIPTLNRNYNFWQ